VGGLPSETRTFSPLQSDQVGSGDHRASCSMGITFLLSGIKRPEREVDNSLQSSSEVNISRMVPFVSLYLSMVSCLTLNLPTTTIVAQPFNVIKWQLNFNPVA
jgi:hypothetical protein